MHQRWYVYSCSPIDFNWEYLVTIEEMLVKLTAEPIKTFNRSHQELSSFLAEWRSAFFAYTNGKMHEARFGQGPSVIPIPDPDNNDFEWAFAFKRCGKGENGETVIISPVELPWLKSYEMI